MPEEEEKKKSLNLLDTSSILEVKDETAPDIYYFSIDEIVKGQIEVTLRVGRVEEEIGSGIVAYKWILERDSVRVGEVEKTPDGPELVLEDLYQTFTLTEPAETGEVFTGKFIAWNISGVEAEETASTIVKGVKSLNLLDSSSTSRVSDGAPPYIEIHSLTGVSRDSTSITVEATIYDVNEYGQRTDTLEQIRLVLNVTDQPEQAITEEAEPGGYDRAKWTFTVDPLKKFDEIRITIFAIDVGGEESSETRTERIPGLPTLNLLDSEGTYELYKDEIPPEAFQILVAIDYAGRKPEVGSTQLRLQAFLRDEAEDYYGRRVDGLLKSAKFSLWLEGYSVFSKEWTEILKTEDFFPTPFWTISELTGGVKDALQGEEIIHWSIEAEDTSGNKIYPAKTGTYTVPPPIERLEYWFLVQPFEGDTEVRIEFKLKFDSLVGVFLGIDEPPQKRIEEPRGKGIHLISIATAPLRIGQMVNANLEVEGVMQTALSKMVIARPVRPLARTFGWAFSFPFGE